MAYFDNAATTFPKPPEVYDFMNKFYRECGANAGRGNYSASLSSGKLINDTRKKLQTLLHCPSKQVIFTSSATIALNMIILGILKTGAKNVYISPFEHNAVTRTLFDAESQNQINVKKLFVTKDFSYDIEKIKYQFEDCKPDFVIMSHASNVFGLISPVEKIFSLAKNYGAITLVDMAQTAGLVDFDVGSEHVDFAVFAGHKTLYGPTGISGFVMKPSFNLPCVLFGGTGYDSANQQMPSSLPQKYEMGTQNILGIAGLNASLSWLEKIGIENIWQKEKEHRKRLLEILQKFESVKLIGVTDSEYVGIVSVIIDGLPSDSAGSVFDSQNIAVRTGLQCSPIAHKTLGTYPAGTIRFSTSYFTADQDFIELQNSIEYIENNL